LIEQAQRRRRRRWPLTLGALIVVVVVAIVGAVGWWFSAGAEYWARSRWQPPKEALLSSMRVQPIPGWKTSVADLGLPGGSTIAKGHQDSGVPGSIIETPEHSAVLLASSPGPTAPQWWLAGINVNDGHVQFRPVALSVTAVAPSCFANGSSVVCISDDGQAATAWVIETQTGHVTYSGPTELRLHASKLQAAQVGGYVVAAADGQGIYGVGPNAETTWFAPGIGKIFKKGGDVAVQGSARGSYAINLISVEHGKVITPALPDDTHLEDVNFFEDGFAAIVVTGNEGPAAQFFDDAEKPTNERRVPGLLGGTTGNLTAVLEDRKHIGMYGPNGDRLLDLGGERPNGMQLIGTTLWVGETSGADGAHFQPYDLRTGDKGKSCAFDAANGYLGTDGSVFVRAPSNQKSDDLTQAYDLATCDKVWSIPRTVGSSGQVTRIGDTLVQLSNDGTKLMSLVPPS
jgi:hypothetical protein